MTQDTFAPTACRREDGWRTRCLHELFERQAEKTPNAIAISSAGKHITYSDLNHRANQVAHVLQARGIGPERVVGLYWERATNVETLVTHLLGILKAGGAYLFLDPNRSMLPLQRLEALLRDARPSIILTEQHLLSSLPSCDASIVCSDAPGIAQHRTSNPISGADVHSLAYLIYTSGSTGTPKGVLVTHRGIGNLAQAYIEVFNMQPGDRIAQYFSFAFDASVAEIATGLLSGATLYPVPAPALRPGPALAAFLQSQAITIATFTPSILSALPVVELPCLRLLIIAGEVCSAELVARWSKPGRLLVNAYGPTEATVLSAFGLCEANNRPPTIGRSIPHVHISIRDEAHLPRPDGEEGEICISGINLARGYTDPTATAASFIADPLDPAVVLYLTGDRGYRDPDGNLVCVGRLATSTTVKVRGGFRVDLSEIEAVLLPVVAACAVVRSYDGHLLAFVVLPETQPSTVSALYDHLRTRLPSYMLPTTIIPLESLPRTASDKIDREALRRSLPNWRQLAQQGAFQGARTPVEVHVTEIVAETLNALNLGSPRLLPQEINLLKTFGELGGDSLSTAEVLLRFATAFHVDLDEELLDRLPLAQIIARIDPLEGEG